MAPHATDENFDQLELLLAKALEGTLDAEGKVSLNGMLRENPEALSRAFEILADEAALHDTLTGMETGELLELSDFLPKVAQPSKHSQLLRWTALAASVVFAFFIGYRVSSWNGEDEGGNFPQVAAYEGPAAEVVLAFDAIINGGVPEVGSGLGQGDYEIEKGSVEIRFRNGVQALVEGPGQFSIQDDMHMVMKEGKIRTRVPEAGKGFTIETPDVDVVDLGTEFGVAVQEEASTEVHVFSGLVELHEASHEQPRLLREGFAAGWREGKPAAFPKRPDDGAFHSPRTLSHVRWRSLRDEVLQDPSLMIYYDFSIFPSGSVIQNLVNPGVYDGQISGATRVQGRWPEETALLFEGLDHGVQLEIPEALEEFTLCAWIKIDRFNSTLCALFNSVGLKTANFHWQLRENGQIRTSSQKVFYSNTKSSPLRSGEWIHVAVTFSLENRKVRVYTEGTVRDTAPLQGVSPVVIGKASIGRWEKPTYWPKERALQGRIDEFLLYNRALDTHEIRKLYVEGSSADW